MNVKLNIVQCTNNFTGGITMSKKVVQIKELPTYIGGLAEELKNMRYAESTIKSYCTVLRRFCKFAEEANIEFYDSFAVQKFVIKNNGDNFDDKYFANRFNRPFAMLDDFIHFNCVARAKYQGVCDFKSGYLEYFTPFLEYLKSRNYAEQSICNCRSHLLRFQEYMLSNEIDKLPLATHDIVRKYCDTLGVYSTTTSAGISRNIRNMFVYLKIHNMLDEDFSVDIPIFKNTRGEKLPEKFTSEEVTKIISVIDKNNPIGKRDYAIVLTAVRLGLRSGDVTKLKFSSLDWTKKELRIKQQKTGVFLTLPLPDDVGWAIIDYIKNGRPCSDSEYVFVSHNAPFQQLTRYTNYVSAYMRKAGIYSAGRKKLGMHTLRKTLATSMLEKDVPVTIIAQTLGHSDLNSVGSYIRISTTLLKKCAMEVTDFE